MYVLTTKQGVVSMAPFFTDKQNFPKSISLFVCRPFSSTHPPPPPPPPPKNHGCGSAPSTPGSQEPAGSYISQFLMVNFISNNCTVVIRMDN